MVAIVTGNGLGLYNASLNILGGAGVWGQGTSGQAGGRSWVNAATGNLVLQVQDEQLSGSGIDLLHVRTYNSLGTLSGGDADSDGDGWRWDGERLIQGTNGSSTVSRLSGDGHKSSFTLSGSVYVSTEGSGAHDTLAWNAGANEWIWVDGSSRATERYDGSTGRLKSIEDTSGNVLSFSYDGAGKLSTVTDTKSKQKFVLTYSVVPLTALTRLEKVESYSLTVDVNGRATNVLGTALKQVTYGYDSLARLTSVTTDLTPDNSTSDGKVYSTTYGYDGSSFRVAGITQSDGTAVAAIIKGNAVG